MPRPAAEPPEAPRRPRRRGLGIALGTGLVLAGGGTAILESETHQVERHETTTHEITAVHVGTGSGHITVHGSGAPGTVEVVRSARLRMGNDLPPLASWDGNQLLLVGRHNNSEDSGIDYEVRVSVKIAWWR